MVGNKGLEERMLDAAVMAAFIGSAPLGWMSTSTPASHCSKSPLK